MVKQLLNVLRSLLGPAAISRPTGAKSFSAKYQRVPRDGAKWLCFSARRMGQCNFDLFFFDRKLGKAR